MIASLSGKIERCGDGNVVVDVNGVGYLVHCPIGVVAAYSGQEARLLIETVVRDNAIVLYGFRSEGERAWFRVLITIRGVGPRTALSLLSTLTLEELAHAVISDDTGAIARADGIGMRTAGRIVNELRERADDLIQLTGNVEGSTQEPSMVLAIDSATSALRNLGYPAETAASVVKATAFELGQDVSFDTLVKTALSRVG